MWKFYAGKGVGVRHERRGREEVFVRNVDGGAEKVLPAPSASLIYNSVQF